jgi:hypothetical protein
MLEAGEMHAPYLTSDCQYCHAKRRKLKLETAYHPQREILRMRANSPSTLEVVSSIQAQ